MKCEVFSVNATKLEKLEKVGEVGKVTEEFVQSELTNEQHLLRKSFNMHEKSS